MLNGNRRCFRVKNINPLERDLIYAYLQGAVYRKCNEKPNDWFAARDLVGGKNYYWQGTPLIVVYERFRKAYPQRSSEYAEDLAAKAIGHMLKRVIVDDKRTFDMRKQDLVNQYKWTGVEDNSITPKWQKAAAFWYKKLRKKAEECERLNNKINNNQNTYQQQMPPQMGQKKKIGIMTFHRALNYGAVWQCWALKRACEKLGHKVETIDYNPFGHYTIRGALMHRPIVAYTYVMQMMRFNEFVHRRLNPSTHTESHEWIKKNPPQDDVYIVGSDQVWAKTLIDDLLDSYLLDFAPSHVKRISYAASTGGNSLELNDYQLGELRKFSAISLREKQAVHEIQSKVNIPVFDVCDPSLLLTKEDYLSLEQKPLFLPKHYVVCFNLAGDSFCEEFAKILSKQLGLPIVNMVGKYKSWAKKNYPAPTPEQWLYIIHHADFVCTNSFHGACFSLIMRRPFVYCGAKEGNRVRLNDRITNLLEQVGMLDRYVTDIERVSKDVIGGRIVYDEKMISRYRERSIEWLKNALEDETDKE